MWLADQGFSASLARGVQTPTQEARALASSLTSLQKVGNALGGTLPSDTAKDLLATGQHINIANNRQIEASPIHQHDGWYYLFVNWGKCCSGVDSTYNIRVGRSRLITTPYRDKDGVDLANGILPNLRESRV